MPGSSRCPCRVNEACEYSRERLFPFVRPQLIAIKQSAFVKLILLLLCYGCVITFGMADKCKASTNVALCLLAFLIYFNHLFVLAEACISDIEISGKTKW